MSSLLWDLEEGEVDRAPPLLGERGEGREEVGITLAEEEDTTPEVEVVITLEVEVMQGVLETVGMGVEAGTTLERVVMEVEAAITQDMEAEAEVEAATTQDMEVEAEMEAATTRDMEVEAEVEAATTQDMEGEAEVETATTQEEIVGKDITLETLDVPEAAAMEVAKDITQEVEATLARAITLVVGQAKGTILEVHGEEALLDDPVVRGVVDTTLEVAMARVTIPEEEMVKAITQETVISWLKGLLS